MTLEQRPSICRVDHLVILCPIIRHFQGWGGVELSEAEGDGADIFHLLCSMNCACGVAALDHGLQFGLHIIGIYL